MADREFPAPEDDEFALSGVEDAAMEEFMAEHHDEIEAKLAVAREQIARGEVMELEPLEDFLRAMREA